MHSVLYPQNTKLALKVNLVYSLSVSYMTNYSAIYLEIVLDVSHQNDFFINVSGYESQSETNQVQTKSERGIYLKPILFDYMALKRFKD